MRLAQLSRKVNTSSDDILKFLKSELNVELENDPNAKIEDEHLDAVLANFQEPEEEVQEVEEAPQTEETEETPEEMTAEAEPSQAEETTEEEEEEDSASQDTVQIVHDDGSEEATEEEEEKPFVEVEVDENAPLIKAEKPQLEGIKVVGKIDLPTKKSEEEAGSEEVSEEFDENMSLPTAQEIEAEIEREEKAAELMAEAGDPDDLLAELEASQKSVSQDIKAGKTVVAKAKEVEENIDDEENSIYKDKRGNYRFTREQRENRAKRLKEVEAQKKEKALKAKKERHYKEMMESKAAPPKKKGKKKEKSATDKEKEEKPKSAWGKFLRWLND